MPRYLVFFMFGNQFLNPIVNVCVCYLLPPGYETVKALVKMNATAVMACRSLDKATAAKQAIVKETGVSESKVSYFMRLYIRQANYA